MITIDFASGRADAYSHWQEYDTNAWILRQDEDVYVVKAGLDDTPQWVELAVNGEVVRTITPK